MPPRPRRTTRKVVREIDALTFAAGWRLTQDADLRRVVEGIHVDVIRPKDLVAFSCTFVECDLEAGGAKPPTVLPRAGKDAKLIVQHSFQHAAEAAIFEHSDNPVWVPEASKFTGANKPVQVTPPPSSGTTQPGVGFVPARKSRVVFDLTGTTVEFTTSGILDAMTRLPLVLADLAKPGADAPTTGSIDGGFIVLPPIVIHLGDNLVAEMRASGPVILNATKEFLKTNPAPDTRTVAGAMQLARNREAFRIQSVGRTPVVVVGTKMPAESVFQPGRGLTVLQPGLPGVIGRLRRNKLSAPPEADQTSIEAPYRLVISPTEEARFAHATQPVAADDAIDHVELWHSRLANLPLHADEGPNEHQPERRVIRALWARDREWVGDDWKTKTSASGKKETDKDHPLSHPDPADMEPFLMSLDRLDRHMLVRQTSEAWIGLNGPIAPVPVAADALWLSSLGAWVDLHGAWTTKPYSEAEMQSILSWDHVAPMGRDQFVRVVYPGYLFPYGHQAALVKITERKIKTETRPYAGLYQRMFIALGERTRSYPQLSLPLNRIDIRPLVTPNIDYPTDINSFFWPRVGGADFEWTIHGYDRDSQHRRFRTPLLWVNAANQSFSAIEKEYNDSQNRILDAGGQNIAFVSKQGDKPDSRLETERIWLRGKALRGGDSIPSMLGATVKMPAVQRLSPTGALAIRFRQEYVDGGLGSAGVGDVWAEVIQGPGYTPGTNQEQSSPATEVKFGSGGAGSDKSGGFFSPNLPVRAISAATGPVGDMIGASANKFDAEKFLQGSSPLLFGLIPLVELLDLGKGEIPGIVTDTLGQVGHFVKDAQRLIDLVHEAKTEADKLLQRAQTKGVAALITEAQNAQQAALDAGADVQAFVDEAAKLLTDPSTDGTAVITRLAAARNRVNDLAPKLPPLIRDELKRYLGIIDTASSTLVEAVEDLRNLVEKQELSFHFDWKPKLVDWPTVSPIFKLKDPDADNLVLSVEGRVRASGDADVSILAEIRDFTLNLFGTNSLMRVPFDHMSFKSGTSGKTEVDVVLGEIEFVGLLSFVETIKDLIPLDGFSDPPFMEVNAQGAKAGFTLALPSVAIGVFNLSNMSLGADVSVPFIGKSVTVGFNFCTRERPFTLTVMCLGGGGWFLVRVGPKGLDILEVGLEATACLAIDLGVASGSISASIGLYIRLEGEKGSLTGYFRLRGEVDVLGLISASIELYMELVYQFDTGKMVGRATITVEIDILFFSGSVQISAERQFAGSNGDPSFREVLGAESGTSPYWNEYAAAFAAEEA
jgi:hypothetical protein